jgi:putative ABC transport system substrate-binding protein
MLPRSGGIGGPEQATRTAPIFFLRVSHPVGNGFVPSLARRGGNITGFTNFEFSMLGKWLEMLKEVAPYVTSVAVIYNPDNPTWRGDFPAAAINSVAPAFAVALSATHHSSARFVRYLHV